MIAADPETEKVVITNQKARHEFFILETYEAGIVLKGTEVKSLRNGDANLNDAYALVKNGEVWILNMHISPYEQGNIYNHDPERKRRLLLHKREIDRLAVRVEEKGLTLIPLRVYFNARGIAKCQLGVAKGKRQADKRETIKKRDWQREQARLLRARNR